MSGITDRDHFAAAALTGLLAQGDDGSFSEESYVRGAYRWADAMLRERAKTNHDAAPEATAWTPGTGDTTEPVAWGVFRSDGEVAVIAFKRQDAEARATASDRIVSLYRHPHPTLTDAERDDICVWLAECLRQASTATEGCNEELAERWQGRAKRAAAMIERLGGVE